MRILMAIFWMAFLFQCTPQKAHRTEPGGNTRIESFSKAKKEIYRLFEGQQRTFYCGCTYQNRKIDHGSCGYTVRKNIKRARRTEIEHVVPAHAFGRSFAEWRVGHADCVTKKGKAFKGRNCARKASATFRRMEADLFNLQPTIGEVNGDRKNYSMAILEGELRKYGQCDVEIADRKIEPRPAIRGDIARAYLYMDWAYPGRGIVGKKRRRLFEAWDKADPVDAWEYERTQRIARIQGNTNPFVGAVGSSGSRPAK